MDVGPLIPELQKGKTRNRPIAVALGLQTEENQTKNEPKRVASGFKLEKIRTTNGPKAIVLSFQGHSLCFFNELKKSD